MTYMWDCDIAYNWMLRKEMNDPFYAMHPERFAPWDKARRIAFFPNPVKGNVIRFNNNKELNITIYDILGKLVLKAHIDRSSNTLNVSPLRKGIYILKIDSDSRSITKKLIRQ